MTGIELTFILLVVLFTIAHIVSHAKAVRRTMKLEEDIYAARFLVKIGEVTVNQFYTHRKDVYKIEYLTNLSVENSIKWPVMVTYSSTTKGTIYTRPLHDFLKSCKISTNIHIFQQGHINEERI